MVFPNDKAGLSPYLLVLMWDCSVRNRQLGGRLQLAADSSKEWLLVNDNYISRTHFVAFFRGEKRNNQELVSFMLTMKWRDIPTSLLVYPRPLRHTDLLQHKQHFQTFSKYNAIASYSCRIEHSNICGAVIWKTLRSSINKFDDYWTFGVG